MKRTLGKGGIEISALGIGCWAIGGPYRGTEEHFGWSEVDDVESTRAINEALDLGINFFDTASSYGAGHSEVVLGRALGARRDEAVIATKWGPTFDEARRLVLGEDSSVAYVRACLDGSLRRLGTDHVDLYQLHLGNIPTSAALDMIPTLEELVVEGKIRGYGWSTDHADKARAFAEAGAHCTAMQYDHSVLHDAPEMVRVCEDLGLAGIDRGPLAMGLLTGKYHDGRTVAADDVRSQPLPWMVYFRGGAGDPEWLSRVDAVREVLTSDGRTLTQGALAWLWARSPVSVPIPGFRTVAQVHENAAALAKGPLTSAQYEEVEALLRPAAA
jgi:aryl-alcohol dehydrogenase-like predicted oxidoreductase